MAPRQPAKWLAADDRRNPFGVPLLDLMALQELIATSQDPACAERSVSWGGSVGKEAPLPLFERLKRTRLDLTLPNNVGFTALHAAAEVDHAGIVPWLVAHALPLEARTKHGHTALHVACALGHAETAKALLSAGADINASSPGGTPRDIALAENQPALAALLDTQPR